MVSSVLMQDLVNNSRTSAKTFPERRRRHPAGVEFADLRAFLFVNRPRHLVYTSSL
jgi:hypothetical protein